MPHARRCSVSIPFAYPSVSSSMPAWHRACCRDDSASTKYSVPPKTSSAPCPIDATPLRVRPAHATANSTHSEEAAAMTKLIVDDTPSGRTRTRQPFYRDLTFQVLAGMAVGVAVGAFAPDVGRQLKPLGDIFIRLIQMVVGLIIFCTVTHGIASVRDLGKVGRIAIKALIYFEVVTTIALVIGLVTINVLQPGVGMHIDPATLHAAAVTGKTAVPPPVGIGEFLVNLVPKSAVNAFAQGEILQI